MPIMGFLMDLNNLSKIKEKALIESNKALSKGEIPVGAVIFHSKSFDIISSAYNKELINKDPTAHAEVLAIRSACQKLSQKRLDNCSIFTTLQPCLMCFEIIKNSRIKEIYYIFENQNIFKDNIQKPKLIKVKARTTNLVKLFFKTKR